MASTNDNIEELRRQAYFDAQLSRKANVDKYRNYADPILQQNNFYVSVLQFKYTNYIKLIQKLKEAKPHIESKNYFKKIDRIKEKIEKPKKTFIGSKDCLDKEFKDKTPFVPEVPHKKPVAEYEKINHRNKIERRPKTVIPQEDNAFNFEPPEKGKTQKKMVEEQVPSNYYKKTENSKNYYNHWLNIKPPKTYNDKGRKDNINDLFNRNLTAGNLNKERPHKKVNYKNTEVQQIFEKGKVNIPVGYKEPPARPGKGDFDEFASSALKNYESIRKNGRKPLKKDF